jgi:hypothetical protein
MLRSILTLFIAFNFHIVLSQDSTILKIAYSGSYFTVPPGKVWVLNRAFINDGGQYNIAISNNNFLSEYSENEKIQLPYYIPEIELLNSKQLMQYQLYFKEYDISENK